MIFNKNIQYGLSFALYLAQAGRATVDTASENLKLSKLFLYQIARKLKASGVIKAVRGPGGGYELIGEPTMRDVISALDKKVYINEKDLQSIKVGSPEQRALANFVVAFRLESSKLMNISIKKVFVATIEKEKAYLDNLSADVRMT